MTPKESEEVERRVGLCIAMAGLIGMAVAFIICAVAHGAEPPKHPDGILTDQCFIKTVFSPKSQAQDMLVDTIEHAKSEILVAAYGLNNIKIVDALIAAKKRGVDIKVKLDHVQSSLKNQKIMIAKLKAAKIDAQVSQLSRLLHDKFMVIDMQYVWTGSYNFTTQAQDRNRENAILIGGCTDKTPQRYAEEWEYIEIKAK